MLFQEKAFNQGTVLGALRADYAAQPGGPQMFSQVQGGICYMLSIDWLRQLLEPGKDIRSTILDNPTAGASLMYYKQATNNYYKFMLDFARTHGYLDTSLPVWNIAEVILNHGHNFVNACDTRYTELCTKNTATVRATTACNQKADVQRALETPASDKESWMMLWLSLPYAAGASAHEMAAYIRNGALYFYDPNSGIWSGSAAEIADEIYSAYVDGRALTAGQTPVLYVSEWRRR